MKTESIHWHAVEDLLPDDACTVLVATPMASETVWMGYYEDGEWHVIDGSTYELGVVVAWAHLPKGPV